MADGPTADEGLGNLGHGDGAQHPGVHPELFKGVLEREGVDHCRQHAHVIAGGPLDALLAALESAKDVSAAHHDHHLDLQFLDLLDLAGHVVNGLGIDAKPGLPAQRFTAEFQQDATVFRLLGSSRGFLHWLTGCNSPVK